MTNRAVTADVSSIGPGVAADGAAVQSPNSASTSRMTASGSTSPAITIAARAGSMCAVVDRPQLGGGQRPRRSRPSRPTAGDTGSTARRSRRRTPRRRVGAGRPWPGAGPSGARRAGGRPRAPGKAGAGGPRPAGPARARGGDAGTSSPANVASQPASAWSEAPEPLGGLGQGDGVADLGALGQGAGREDRRAAQLGGLVGGARADDQRRRHERTTGHRRDDHAQAVGELRPDGGRELVGARLARDGSLRDRARGRSCRLLVRTRRAGRRRGRPPRPAGRSGRRGCRPGTPRGPRRGSARRSPRGSAAAGC